MPFFKKRSHKEDLINDEIFHNTRNIALSKRVDYAWKVCYNRKSKYTEHDRDTALRFLKSTFDLHLDHDPEELKRTLERLMHLKATNPGHQRNYIPTLADIAPPATPISEITPPAEAILKSTVDVRSPISSINTTDFSKKIKRIRNSLALNQAKYTQASSQEMRENVDGEFILLNKELQFLTELNHDFNELNTFIHQYNDQHDTTPKLTILQKIYQQQKKLDDKFSPYRKNYNYHIAIHVQLFNDLKKQLPLFGLTTLSQLDLSSHSREMIHHDPEKEMLVNILEHMSPEKVSKMLGILLAGALYNKEAFKHLYADERTEEALLFNAFFSTHNISFLGGRNSQNFEITQNHGLKKIVLKIDNRLASPKDLDAGLRKEAAFQDILTPVFAERQTTYIDPMDRVITRSLLLTTYCSGGSLAEQSSLHATDDQKRMSAIHFFTQMANILKQMQQNNCAFIDMKNSNWLIGDHENLVIADTKSFVFSNSDIINFSDPKNRWYDFIQTKFMSPPEYSGYETYMSVVGKSIPFSADKAHAYMLGKNLYLYLTNCEESFLMNKHRFNNKDFTIPIFSTPQGQKLKRLITALVQPKPKDRMSLDSAYLALKTMGSIISFHDYKHKASEARSELSEPTRESVDNKKTSTPRKL